MPTLIKIIRLLFALIAIWQLFGLLPVLNWLPDLPPRGSEVWALLMIKVAALAISGAIYFALRAIGKRYSFAGAGPSDAKIIIALVIAIPVLGFVAGIVTPMLAKQGSDAPSSKNMSDFTPTAVVPQTFIEACYYVYNPPAGLSISTQAVNELHGLPPSEIFKQCKQQMGIRCAELTPPTTNSARPGLFDDLAMNAYNSNADYCKKAGYEVGIEPWEINWSQ